MKKVTISIMLVAVLGFGGFVAYKDINAKAATSSQASQYATAKASVQNIQVSVSGSGSVLSSETETLKAAGRDTVASVLVSSNQVVTKGQELITFENGSDPIVAPYDGVISAVGVSAGDNVATGQQLVTIFDNKNLYTTISVDETDLPSLQVGQKANIKVNAYPDTQFTGTVTNIAQEGTYSNGVSTFNVNISFDNVQNIKVGMSTEATIVTQSKDNVLAIPIEAVRDMKGGKYVMIPSANANGTPTFQKVEVGISNGRMVEITNGLVAGQEVELPQVQSSSNSSNKSKGFGGFGMMQGGGARNNRQSGGNGGSQGNSGNKGN